MKLFQLEAEQKYEIKFTREKGFFYTKIAVCKNDGSDDYDTCLEDLKDSDDMGKKIVTKTEEFGEDPCSKCIVFIKLQAEEPAEAIIHIQSKYSMIDLKEKDVVSDFLNEGETNKYSITTTQNEETVINV